ncbi:hypothetical protein C8T65DRAFT_664804 [Cerioporus squamosus]|nr:hypothetical protein C8T65DRAFT_664804 [Cerioporus squamosus]
MSHILCGRRTWVRAVNPTLLAISSLLAYVKPEYAAWRLELGRRSVGSAISCVHLPPSIRREARGAAPEPTQRPRRRDCAQESALSKMQVAHGGSFAVVFCAVDQAVWAECAGFAGDFLGRKGSIYDCAVSREIHRGQEGSPLVGMRTGCSGGALLRLPLLRVPWSAIGDVSHRDVCRTRVAVPVPV